MKREEVKAKIPGITDEQLDWLMNENGNDINTEKNNTSQAQGELAAARKTIEDLQNAAKDFEGVDVGALKKQLSDLQTKYDADIAAIRRDSAIDLALSGRRAKNSKAARALLDLDSIKMDGDKLTGLDEQLETLQKENPWMFEDERKNSVQVNTGGEHGTGGSVDADGVTAAFARLNPGLKID